MKVGLIAASFFIASSFLIASLTGATMKGMDDKTATAPEVPAYHNAPPRGRDAKPLDLKGVGTDERMRIIYGRANDSRKVLYQLPCYCKCTRYLQHTSLLSCYREKHATTCDICQKEAIYAYEQMRKGKSAEQIRQDIVAGKWKDINVDSYIAASGTESKAH